MLNSNEVKELIRCFDTRNDCAHPSNFICSAEKARDIFSSIIDIICSKPVLFGCNSIDKIISDLEGEIFFPNLENEKVKDIVQSNIDKFHSKAIEPLLKKIGNTIINTNVQELLLFLIKNNIKSVIDIGCQLGLQSELFIRTGIHYTGIDNSTVRFFNDDCTNVDFKFDNFMNVDIKDKVCIASMSVGYFSDDIYSDKDYIKKLSECKRLYIVSTPEFIEELKLSMNLVYKLHNVSLDIEKNKDLSISDGYVYVFEKNNF